MNTNINDLPPDNIRLDVTETGVNMETPRIILNGMDVTNVYHKGILHGWQVAHEHIEKIIKDIVIKTYSAEKK